MLIDKDGKVFDAAKLPKDRTKRQKILAELREVPGTRRGHGRMFKLETRGRLGK